MSARSLPWSQQQRRIDGRTVTQRVQLSSSSTMTNFPWLLQNEDELSTTNERCTVCLTPESEQELLLCERFTVFRPRHGNCQSRACAATNRHSTDRSCSICSNPKPDSTDSQTGVVANLSNRSIQCSLPVESGFQFGKSNRPLECYPYTLEGCDLRLNNDGKLESV